MPSKLVLGTRYRKFALRGFGLALQGPTARRHTSLGRRPRSHAPRHPRAKGPIHSRSSEPASMASTSIYVSGFQPSDLWCLVTQACGLGWYVVGPLALSEVAGRHLSLSAEYLTFIAQCNYRVPRRNDKLRDRLSSPLSR